MKDELFPNGSIDRWLRQHADEPGALPAPDGWDTPSPQVWEQVRAGIRARKKRRRPVWFWWLLLGVCGAGAGLVLWKNNGREQAADAEARKERVQATLPVRMDKTPAVAGEADRPEKAGYDLKQARPGKAFIDSTKPASEPPGSATAASNAPAQVTEAAKAISISSHPGGKDHNADRQTEPAPVAFGLFFPLPQKNMTLFQPDRTWKGVPSAAPIVQRGRHFYLGLHMAAMFTTRILRPETAGIRPNGVEKGAWTWQTGLEAGLQLNPHWCVETGLQRASVRLDAQRRGSFRFRTDQERYNAQRQQYESTARQGVQTAFGEVDMRFDMSRTAAQPIPDQALVYYVLQTREQLDYLRIPVAIRYRACGPRWHWGFAAGAGLNIRYGYAMDVTAARTDRPGIRHISVQAERRARGLAGMLADVQGDVRIGYLLSRHCIVSLGPEGRYGLGSMYKNGPFRSYPVSLGGRFGLTYKF